MKKIAFMMLALALVLASSKAKSIYYTPPCSEYTEVFSDNLADYEIGIDLDEENNEYSILYYGRMNESFEFSDLKRFGEVYVTKYPPWLETAISLLGTKLLDEKVLVNLYKKPTKPIPWVTNCTALEKRGNSNRAPFRCKSEKLSAGNKNTSTLFQVLESMFPTGTNIRFIPAKHCMMGSPNLSFKDLVAKGHQTFVEQNTSDTCSEFINFFSENPDDHMIMLHLDMDKKNYYIAYYGKLTPAHNFSELTKTFNDLSPYSYPPNFDTVVKQHEDIADQKMLPFSWWTSPAGSTAVPSDCEAIQGGTAFRCTSKRFDLIGSSNREDVIETYTGSKVGFRAAEPCNVPSPYWKFKDMISRGESADKDSDGIPDSFEALPKDITAEECVGDRDCDGVTDAMDECPDEAGELKLAGCPPAAGETAELPAGAPSEDVIPGIPRGFDEGGMCSLISSVSVNPASFSLIAAALVALSRRRRK